MRGLIKIVFSVICIFGAINAAVTMFTTFAPLHASGFLPGESAAIERVRNYLWPHVNVAVGLLLVSAIWMLLSGWMQLRNRAARHALAARSDE